jgi:phosphoheptose isomerase
MRALIGASMRRRALSAAFLALVGAMVFMVSGAFADAGNPILGTIKASAVDNGNGTVTIFVRGQWNWLSHGNDCNDDRNGAGVGIVWNDTTEPGYLVSDQGVSARVGIASLRNNDNVNKIDQMVHPSDRGNIPQGYTVNGSDYPFNQQFVDPSPPGITTTQMNAWRSGCGRKPISATAPKGNHPEKINQPCADNTTADGNPVGSTACANHPWGSWGYEKSTVIPGKGTFIGYSHTYDKNFLPDRVCVNFYDVHGSNAGFEDPNGTKEITVGPTGSTHNGDNSIETNAFDVNDGANCIEVFKTTTTTDIRVGNNVVTAVEVGTTVHDHVSVVSQGNNAIPTGNVTIDWFTNGTCSGAPADTSGQFTLDPNTGQVDATTFTKTPTAAGLYGFKAHYLGDGKFLLPSDGDCEPLRVVDARISITPPTATNRVGDPHVFTAHVEVNDGTGWSNAPSGSIGFTKSPVNFGTFTTANPCTIGANGSCTITLTSNTTGLSTVTASTSLIVGTVSLTRSTDGTGSNSGPATKRFVDAKISITPSATNRVGQPHTFTATLLADTGAGFAAAAGQPLTITLTGNGATPNPAGPFNCTTNASGQCSVTFTSSTTGTVTGHASSTVTLGNPSTTFTVETDGVGGNSGNAVKTFVDAKISISPSATNRVGQPHTFTATVLADSGNGFTAAAGQPVTITLTGNPGGAVPNPAGPFNCTTNALGQCSATFTSSTTGTVTGHASSTVTLGNPSTTFTVQTDAVGGNSGDAVKAFVDAKISITPSATNRVGQPHTFTATLLKDVGNGFVAAAGQPLTITLTGNGATPNPAGPFNCTTNASGQCSATFTSSTTGTVTGHASSTVTLGTPSTTFTVQTDALGGNSGDAVKAFVDAKISISPSATNRVGQPHTFTATLLKDVGNGFVAAAGQPLTITLTGNPGGAVPNPAGPFNCTTNASGQCSATFTSGTTGTVTGHASSTVTLGTPPTTFTVQTDALGGNSGDAVKAFVDAKISISPSATNEVGQPHTFTATLLKDVGNGFVAAAGQPLTITLTGNGATPNPAGPFNCTTNGSGQCSATFTSATAGTVTGHASSTVTLGNPSTTFTVETDALGGNSGNAVKKFVDANIEITPPAASNPVGTTHTLTGRVKVNAGAGGGYVNAPDGTTINFVIVSGPGGFIGPSSCTTTAGSGSCTAVISSNTTGTTRIRATTDVSVGGQLLHRETGDAKPGDSLDASKVWASAKIAIVPNATHEVGQSHTFTVTLFKDTSTGAFVPAAGEHVDVSLANGNGAAYTAPTGTCMNNGANTDVGGQCTITFTSNAAGTVIGHAAATLNVSGTSIKVETNGIGANSTDAVATFVDANIEINPPTANNPIGTTHTLTGHVKVNTGAGGGFVNAPNGTSINFALSGPASFVGPSSCTTTGGSGSCAVVITSTTTGTTTIKASTDVSMGGVTVHRESGDSKAGDSADATKLWADDTARTDILNAPGNVVTTVVAGTIVHDKVFVARTAGTPAAVPNPTGNVVFHRFSTIDCSGAATDQTVTLTPGATSTALSDDFAPAGNMSYQAEYKGDANYPARTGACEPLTVTPVGVPKIAIVKNPKSQTVAVGGTATFTITVTNVGNTVLTDVHVDDPLTPNCNRTKAQIPALASMAPGASVTYTCTRPNVRAAFDNVATATGTPPTGPNVTASDTAPVKVRALTPAKKKVVKKKKPKVVSHKKPKATG